MSTLWQGKENERRERVPEVGGRLFWLGCFDPFQGFQMGEDESGEE